MDATGRLTVSGPTVHVTGKRLKRICVTEQRHSHLKEEQQERWQVKPIKLLNVGNLSVPLLLVELEEWSTWFEQISKMSRNVWNVGFKTLIFCFEAHVSPRSFVPALNTASKSLQRITPRRNKGRNKTTWKRTCAGDPLAHTHYFRLYHKLYLHYMFSAPRKATSETDCYLPSTCLHK